MRSKILPPPYRYVPQTHKTDTFCPTWCHQCSARGRSRGHAQSLYAGHMAWCDMGCMLRASPAM
eukprot:4877811-Amphidinium_carterae.1